MTDPDPISGNIYRFISVANELPLSAWGASGSGFPTTRSDVKGGKETQWRVERSGRDRWTLQNMYYNEPAHLSAELGTLSITPTPFEWFIRPDRLGGHRLVPVLPKTTEVLSSVGEIGNAYMRVTLQSQDLNKDSQRWNLLL